MIKSFINKLSKRSKASAKRTSIKDIQLSPPITQAELNAFVSKSIQTLNQFLTGDISLRKTVEALEYMKNEHHYVSKKFDAVWYEYWGNLEIRVAFISIDKDSEEKSLIFARQEAQRFISEVSKFQIALEKNHD